MLFEWLQHITFAYPWVLLLITLLPLMGWWQHRNRRKHTAAVTVSTLAIRRRVTSWRQSLAGVVPYVRLAALTLLIVALARPQTRNDEQRAEGEGIDILLCLDVSGSMLAEDFLPNRMEAAKEVASRFIQARPTDRIGLVIFAGEPFTQCPLTTDHAVLLAQLYHVRSGMLQDGTAIGSGLATSVDRLKDSEISSKVIILLTDGENNGGLIPPATARDIARLYGIKVYTIGVGTEGYALMPQQTATGIIRSREKVNIDEALLTDIATATGGRYFRARDNAGLTSIYAEIDRLEKTRMQITTYARYAEAFAPFALAALLLLLLEAFLRYRLFRRFP